ncbi:MAG TPA: flagellin [Bryobacteraceae bacterium]|nr:flagellin [Bryobacteraceae bacterium]
MLSIQTNVNSLVAQQNLNVNNAFQSKTIQQLTSGYRINQSGDDAAGLAVANKFRNDIAEVTQGVANGNDAVAQLQIMDGGMSNISQILDRLKTLAAQSASGSFTGDRTVLNNEFQTDLGEIDRQAQAVGLDNGGTFAKSVAVYMGGGQGTTSADTLANGTVTVDLTKSTVDSQSLGLKGLQVVNASATTGLVAHDIGVNSGTSVQAIVGNTSGAHPNQEALAGYASFYFSAPGFSDAGKIGISVNLTGVSDTTSLATAVNNAIQAAGTGGTAAANAFKAAGITASVYTDANGGQALAFNSATTPFQVQAGDQMANALMGNVTMVSGAAQGTAVTTSVTGSVATTAGTGFTTPQNVHVVISGGGLAQAQDLTLNASSTTTAASISDLLNQFKSNTALVNAGLSLTNTAGGSTLGGNLQFTSATGQAFNVAVTGDTQDLLGLGSFLTNAAGTADYTSITATGAYSASAVTGVLGTTTGAAAGLEISLDGGVSQAITPIDLTAGAHATAANVTGVAVAGGAVDITNTAKALDISVYNNGVLTNWAGNLITNQVATHGAVASSTITSASSVVVDSTHDKFQIAVDGGPLVQVSVANGTYTGGTQLIDAINAAIGGTSLNGLVTAIWDAGNGGKLTFQSASTGAGSSVAVANSATTNTVNTPGEVASASITAASSVVVDATHNTFQIAVDGGASVAVTVANGTYTGGTQLIDAINAAIGGTSLSGAVNAIWDAGNGGLLTFQSASSGASSSVALSNGAANDLLSTTAGKKLDIVSGTHNSGTTSQVTNDLLSTTAGKKLDIVSGTHNSGLADQPSTLDSIATQIQAGLGGAAVVTVTNNSKISISSATKGANSEVVINTPVSNSANTAVGLTGGAQTNPGQNSSIDDIVANLNAQFTNNTAWQAAGLYAYRTNSDGSVNPAGSYISIGSNNATNFRLDALGSGAASAENIGFGTAGQSFQAGTPNAATSMASLNAYGTSTTGAVAFNPILDGDEKQVLTFSANDSTGALQTTSVTLQNNATSRAGRSIDDAVAYINQQLQAATTQPALQSIVAVKQKVGGAEEINFISSLSKFSVGVGGTGSTDGVSAGVPGTLNSSANGSSANMAIDTQAGAQAAVTAITAAVAKLGSAQAAIGKGQNQLNYAINLAQSQITNFSAAESQIRDANVAEQAANLSKAQVLQQASIAAMAQANAAPQAVLSLLKG